MKKKDPLKPLEIKWGKRTTEVAESPEGRQIEPDRESHTGDYVQTSEIKDYRRDSKKINKRFEEFIRDNAGLDAFQEITAEENTKEDPWKMISINSDNDFCDRKEAYLEIPGFFGRLAICCSLATRRENMSVLFLGNILGRTAAKKTRKRKLYCRAERNVSVTAISAEEHAAEEVGTVIPAEIEGICRAVETATISMEKKGKKIEQAVIGEDGIPTTILKEGDPENKTLVINVGVFSVKSGKEAEEDSAVRMCVITCNGVYKQESAMQVMTQLKEDINKAQGCENMGVFIVPMEETPQIFSEQRRYVHCETLFSNMVRDTMSNSSRTVECREARSSVNEMLRGEQSNRTNGLSADGLDLVAENASAEKRALPGDQVDTDKENQVPDQAEEEQKCQEPNSVELLGPPTLKRKNRAEFLKLLEGSELPDENTGRLNIEGEKTKDNEKGPGKNT